LLGKVFGNESHINLKTFTNIVENLSSEIFLYILIFILEKRPFTKTTLENYEKAKAYKETFSKSPNVPKSNRLIASPNLNSKFSPCVTISKSPTIMKKQLGLENNNNKPTDKNNDILMKLAGKTVVNHTSPNNILLKYASATPKQVEETDEGVTVNNVPVSRKNRNPNLTNIKSIEGGVLNKIKSFEEDIQILPAAKYKQEVGLKNKISSKEIEKISKE
jgi:hypothetical protein